MKKLIVIILSCVGYLGVANAQTPAPYIPLAEFRGDTVGFIQYNFEQNKSRYIGQSFKKVVSDFGMPIPHYSIFLDKNTHHNYLKMIHITYRYWWVTAALGYTVVIHFEPQKYFIEENPAWVSDGPGSAKPRYNAMEAFNMLPDYIVSDITLFYDRGPGSESVTPPPPSPLPFIAAPIFTLGADGGITPNSAYITPLPTSGNILKMHGTGNINLASQNYTINVGLLQGYAGSQSSGFNVLEFYSDTQTVLTMKQPALWNYLQSTTSVHDFSAYSGNKYFIRMEISGNAEALVFVGWPYYGHKAQMTIVVATQKEIKVVYNKEAELQTVTKSGNRVSQITALEYNANATITSRTIRVTNGTLYIK